MTRKVSKSRAPQRKPKRPPTRASKTTAKTTGRRVKGQKPPKPPKVPQPHGGALNAGGTPGNKGGTGRPPNALRARLQEIRSNPDVQDELEAAAKDRSCRGFGVAWRILTDYDPEKPKGEDSGQKVEIHVYGPPTGVERTATKGGAG